MGKRRDEERGFWFISKLVQGDGETARELGGIWHWESRKVVIKFKSCQAFPIIRQRSTGMMQPRLDEYASSQGWGANHAHWVPVLRVIAQFFLFLVVNF